MARTRLIAVALCKADGICTDGACWKCVMEPNPYWMRLARAVQKELKRKIVKRIKPIRKPKEANDGE